MNHNFQGKILSIVVTYSNRGHYVVDICTRLFKSGVNKIIIIDNNSTPESSIILDALAKKYPSRIILKNIPYNAGTAYAFKSGLETAREDKQCNFVWILDDDNIPAPDALEELKKLWQNLDLENKETRLMLSSFRKSRMIYKQAIRLNQPDLVFGRKNYFRMFHCKDILIRIFKKQNDKKIKLVTTPDYGLVNAVPYGGMFFNKLLLNTIGYPDEQFYIYTDDYEFSYRVILNNGKIIMSLKSLISDAEDSWNVKQSAIESIVNHTNRSLLYYSIRNRIRLECMHSVKNRWVYILNMLVFLALITAVSFRRKKFKNLKVYMKACYDGTHNKMGISKSFPLPNK